MTTIDDDMVAVASYIEAQGGQVQTDPGQLIRHITEAVFEMELVTPLFKFTEYIRTARALRILEDVGLVRIDRITHDYPHQANKLYQVNLLP